MINGSKQFITNSGTAITSVITVTAVTGRRADGRPALRRSWCRPVRPVSTVGPATRSWAGTPRHPSGDLGGRPGARDHLLGIRGRGYAQFLSTLDDGRIAIAALGLGCIRACRDLARDYALERHSFGGPIGRKQAVAFMIADLDVMTHTAGLLVYAAAQLKDDQTDPESIRPS